MKKKVKLIIGAIVFLAGIQSAISDTCWKCEGDPNGEHSCEQITCPTETIDPSV